METGWTEEKESDEECCACFLSFSVPPLFPFPPPGPTFCLRVRTSWSQNQGKLVTQVLGFTPTPISPLAHLP